MHYNENGSRKQATDDEGQLRYVVKFPKANGGQHTVKPIKESASYGEKTEVFTK